MKRPKFITEFADIPKKRTKMPELPPDERRLNFEEVELGFTEELAKQEAARCLSCRRCIGCGLCLAECDACAVVYDEKPGEVTLTADAVIFAPEARQFDPSRKRDLGYSQCLNVVTSYEFERLSSATGPFGGLVLRPSDGEVPRRIGFIQCVGSRDEAIGANYCSAECCSRTIAQALRAREAIDGVEVVVFHRGLRPAGKTSELQLGAVVGEPRVTLVEAVVRSVREDPETGTVTVAYLAGGAEAEAALDLAVLAVGIEARRDFRRLARAGGVSVNKFGFVDPGVANTIGCKQGVAFAGTVRGPETAEQSVSDALAGASRALGPLPQDAGEEAWAATVRSVASGRPLIFACEYGMALGGVAGLDAGGLDLAGSHPFLCHMTGGQMMAEKLDGATGLVVVGCHAGSHEAMFERLLGLAGGAVRIVDVSELRRGAGRAVEAALSSTRQDGAGIGGRRDTEASRPDRAVGVLGGGVAGLAAASELARRKVKTIIVNDSDVLGGSLSRLPAAQQADANTVRDFVKAVEDHPGVRILRSAEIASVSRNDGALDLHVSTEGREEVIPVDALVIATGTRPYLPTDFPAGTDLVITQDDLAARLAAGRADWNKIVMLQCVGARDAAHPYCSRFCCRQALANARLLKLANPGAQVTILHKGIRVFGFEEELLTDAEEQGIGLIEIADRPAVEAGSPLRVRGASAAGQAYSLESDVLVLSVGHARDEGAQRLAGLTGARIDGLGFFETSDPLIRPFATQAPGVFVCGFARAPVTLDEAFADGLGAAGAVCEYLKERPNRRS